jgi:HEAT repeat protein
MNRTLEGLLQTLSGGSVSPSELYTLSDLSSSEAEAFWPSWAELPTETRRSIAWMLLEIAEEDLEVNFCAFFRQALADDDAEVRRAAVEGLWEDENVRLVPLLAERLLKDPAAEVREAAAVALGRFLLLGELEKIRPRPHQEAFRALLTACGAAEENAEVRRRALESLAYSGETAVADLIRSAYQDPDETTRVSAVLAMGRSGDGGWAGDVMRELESSNPEMRCEAARACGELALEEAAPILIDMLDDVGIDIQEAAIWALGQIGGDEARRVLRACSRSDSEAIRQAALDAQRELEFLHGDLGTFLLGDFLGEDEEEEDSW